ncbi:MAG: hypothetical protein RhofKO_39580 [Rhodothermales bacterium]
MQDLILTAEDLAMRAKVARTRSKETQQQAADHLGVHRQTISDAENQPEKNLNPVRARLIEHYEGVEVLPVWLVRQNDESPDQD